MGLPRWRRVSTWASSGGTERESQGGKVAEGSIDPVVRNYREKISDNDLKILEALNKRLSLVKSLWEYKQTHGISFYDAAQEDWVITYLSRANRGPLSNEGLREIYSVILQTVKQEAAAQEEKKKG
jgi:chorismate mutase